MSKLIALVATAVVVNGERTVIQPGQPLPDLHEHDARELVASGSAQDLDAAAREQRQANRAESEAKKDFEEARERMQGAAESIAAPPAQAEQNPPPPPPAPATSKAKKS
ncbi:MAG TPA: hypothetical protein VGE36_04455 [Roseateles sp.]